MLFLLFQNLISPAADKPGTFYIMTMLVVDGKSKRNISFLKESFPTKIVGIFFFSFLLWQ